MILLSVLVEPLNMELLEFFLVIIEECKYELIGKYLEVSLLCILLECFDADVQTEVMVVINEEAACVSTEVDGFILLLIFELDQQDNVRDGKTEEEDGVILLIALLEITVFDTNMLDLPVVILVDPLNSEVIEFFFVDDVVLSKAEEKDDGLLFSLLFELALLEENTLVVNFLVFVDALNSEKVVFSFVVEYPDVI